MVSTETGKFTQTERFVKFDFSDISKNHIVQKSIINETNVTEYYNESAPMINRIYGSNHASNMFNFTERNLKKLMADAGFNILDAYLIPDNDGLFCNLGLALINNFKPKATFFLVVLDQVILRLI